MGALAREPNVSSKVMALMFKVARIASLSARLESSLVDGTCRSHIETLIALTIVCSSNEIFPLHSLRSVHQGHI